MSQYPPKNPYQTPHGQPQAPQASSPLTNFDGPAPSVVTWQMVYLALMVLVYLMLTVGGICVYIFANEIAAEDPSTDPEIFRIAGVIYSALGFVLGIVFAVGLFWKRGMGGWVYNIILIALGLTSCVTWPMTIPLMIHWIKHKNWIVGPRN